MRPKPWLSVDLSNVGGAIPQHAWLAAPEHAEQPCLTVDVAKLCRHDYPRHANGKIDTLIGACEEPQFIEPISSSFRPCRR